MDPLTGKTTLTFQVPSYEPQPPSPFELGVAEQLRGLASEIQSGDLHIKHFSLTVLDDKQRLEIEVT